MALIGSRVVRSRCSSTNASILLSRENSITILARVCKHSSLASERSSLRCSPTSSSHLWSIQPNAGPLPIHGGSFYSSRGLTTRLFMLPSSCCLHTCSTILKDTDSKPAEQGSKGHEHGSVLMKFVGKEEEPKQLTVGAKGTPSTSQQVDHHQPGLVLMLFRFRFYACGDYGLAKPVYHAGTTMS